MYLNRKMYLGDVFMLKEEAIPLWHRPLFLVFGKSG